MRICVINLFMEKPVPYYLQKMKEDLSQKQRRFPKYSLRAYARDIGIHPATLSQILNGNRPLPIKDSQQVVKKLNLGPKERTLFLESLHRSRVSLDEIKVPAEDNRLMLDESYFNVIAEWEHYAVLTLFDVKDFVATPEEIAKRYGITENRAEVVLNNLLTCGLVRHDENGLVKAQSRVRTTEDVTSIALKKSHLEALEMGKEKLEEVDVAERDFSSLMVAVDKEKILEAKTIIREFRQKMLALLETGEKTEVFQLAIQFYPLTKKQAVPHLT